MVREFVDSCKSAGLISIIEPVSRKPLAGGDFDWNAGILAAAKELGSLGADLYKAEVPFKGQASEAEVRAACAELSKAIDGPWVALSSGVPEDVFPEAVRWACLEGASGFLAGRAVWASCIGSPDVIESLSTDAVQRLQRLCAVVDEVVTAQRTNA
jgi:sulfofructosephosphate aldolase